MPPALVGSAGVVSIGSSGAAVTPAWGTGSNRSVGNLLLLVVFSNGGSAVPNNPTGWNSFAPGTGDAISHNIVIFNKEAAGADAAPTVAAITSSVLTAQLYEFSGNANVSLPLDRDGGTNGTTSPVVATATGADTGPGELVCVAGVSTASMSATATLTHTVNNGVTITSTNNNSTSTTAHYNFGYGITTSNAAATSDSLAVSGSPNYIGVVVSTYKLPPAAPVSGQPVILGQAVGRAASRMQADARRNWWRPRLWLPERPAFAGVYLG